MEKFSKPVITESGKVLNELIIEKYFKFNFVFQALTLINRIK